MDMDGAGIDMHAAPANQPIQPYQALQRPRQAPWARRRAHTQCEEGGVQEAGCRTMGRATARGRAALQ